MLDVRRVWFEPEAGPPRWTVVTFSPWTEELTRDRGYVFVYLDTMGDERFDYYALILSNGRRLSGSLWRDPEDGAPTCGSRRWTCNATPTSTSPCGSRWARWTSARSGTAYRWSVVTTFTGRVCRATCVDRVPDEGAFEQPDRLAHADAHSDTHGDAHGAPTVSPSAEPDRRLTIAARSRRPAAYHLGGDVAQLVEHRLCKAGVAGSNPVVSTLARRATGSAVGTA